MSADTTSSTPPTKRPKLDSSDTPPEPPYELIYWPTIPGRGEFIRVCLEATKTPYIDVTNKVPGDGNAKIQPVLSQISTSNTGSDLNLPPLAPPILRHGELILSQTPAIMLYLAPKIGLAGSTDLQTSDPTSLYKILALALTALDGLSNDAHDTHHPVASHLSYEEQIPESKRRAKSYTTVRLHKFLEYFERVLNGPASRGGEWLFGGEMTFADLTLWQGLDGVEYAFPNAVKRCRASGKYDGVFRLKDRLTEGVLREYLDSERRMDYSIGIWRHYPELDDDEEEEKE